MSHPPGSLPTFTIQFDADQIVFIRTALSLLLRHNPSQVPSMTHVLSNGREMYVDGEQVSELLGLFTGLPAAEAESPGCVHGFCL